MHILVIKYIFINLLLFSSWYLSLFSKRASLSFIDRLIGTFILGLSQIIATELALGIVLKKLYADPLFALNILVSLAVLSLSFFNNKKSSYLKSAAREFKDKTVGFFRTITSDIVLCVLFSLLIIQVCWLIFTGWLFPSYTWDALWYHLPIVGHILQSGAIIENPANFMIDTFINIFPKNIELFFLWNIIFLKRDVITDLSQLPFALIGVITTYSIAMKLKINKRYALYSSFLFFFTPIIILQSTTNYIDIAVSVLLLVTINFLLYENHIFDITINTDRQPDRKVPILLAGISAGILLGSKGSGPLFAILFSLAIIVQEFIKHRAKVYATGLSLRKNIFRQSLIPYVLSFFIPLLLMGSYWYIKNWALYGNPVYPMEIAVFGKTVFNGPYKEMIDPTPAMIENSSSLAGLFYVWMERVEYYLYDSRLSGFGPIWFILLLPSLAFTFINSIIKKRYNWLFIIILLIIIFLAHPRNWNTRYVIFIVALGALSYGFVLDYFSKRERLLSIAALLLAVYTSLTANSPCVTPAKIKEFLNLQANERTIARLAPFNIDLNAKQEYGNWIWISNNISEGDTLAYTFEPLFLSPLWNSGFSSRTAYIKSESYSEWLKMLKENNATYALLRQHSKEDTWIEDERKALSSIGGWFGRPKEKFKAVYSDENYKIMQFLKAEK